MAGDGGDVVPLEDFGVAEGWVGGDWGGAVKAGARKGGLRVTSGEDEENREL